MYLDIKKAGSKTLKKKKVGQTIFKVKMER